MRYVLAILMALLMVLVFHLLGKNENDTRIH
jgi:hypothetical protein